MRMNDRKKQSGAEALCALVLMLLFTSVALVLVALGTHVYRNIVQNMNNNYDVRTSLSYVATKIRQGDAEGKIKLGSLAGLDALVIEENYDGVTYDTWIYHYDKGIYEMFAEENIDFKPQDGMRVMDIESFEIKRVAPKLFSLAAKNDSGKSLDLLVAVRT